MNAFLPIYILYSILEDCILIYNENKTPYNTKDLYLHCKEKYKASYYRNYFSIPRKYHKNLFKFLDKNNIKHEPHIHDLAAFTKIANETKEYAKAAKDSAKAAKDSANIVKEYVDEVKVELRRSERIQNKRDTRIEQVWAVISEIGSTQYKTIHRLINESLLGSIPEPLRKDWLKCSPKSGLLRRNCKYLNPRNFRNIPDEVHLHMYDILKSLDIIH